MADNIKKVLEKTILPVLAPKLRAMIKQAIKEGIDELVEIRLRVHKALLLEKVKGEVLISKRGEVVKNPAQAYRVSKDDIQDTLNLMTNNSLYTLEEE
ncbi:MAG: stage III sporulation protein AA, partial [Halanaerobacter sp.]